MIRQMPATARMSGAVVLVMVIAMLMLLTLTQMTLTLMQTYDGVLLFCDGRDDDGYGHACKRC